MKKLLLATAVSLFAVGASAGENSFYVRGDAGASWMPKAKLNGVSGKKKSVVTADLGVGTNLMDNVRTELLLANDFNPKQKFSNATTSATAKVKGTSLQLRALVDVFDYGYGQLFLGGGVGLTQLSTKVSQTVTTPGAAGAAATTATTPYKAKKKNNACFLGTVGTAFDLSEGVKADVAYTYTDHGKTKEIKPTTGNGLGKFHYKTHAVTAGVRFEL